MDLASWTAVSGRVICDCGRNEITKKLNFGSGVASVHPLLERLPSLIEVNHRQTFRIDRQAVFVEPGLEGEAIEVCDAGI